MTNTNDPQKQPEQPQLKRTPPEYPPPKSKANTPRSDENRVNKVEFSEPPPNPDDVIWG